ncbi:MAG: hypothetical protein ACP5U2_03805 [Bryobacteraceae bacterium]
MAESALRDADEALRRAEAILSLRRKTVQECQEQFERIVRERQQIDNLSRRPEASTTSLWLTSRFSSSNTCGGSS